MSEYLSYTEVCGAFAKLAMEQRIPVFKRDTEESVAEYLASYGNSLLQGPDFVFTVPPAIYITEAFTLLAKSGFPWVSKDTEPRYEGLQRVTSKQDAMFLNAFNIYLKRCQVHETVAAVGLTEALNYFIKKDEEGVSPLKGPFEKIPSTFFGTEQLDFWDIEFPDTGDMVVVYTKEGFLRMIIRYQGKTARHY